MTGPIILRLIGDDIRHHGVRFRLHLRRVGPKGTEFDYWLIGFRLFSLFVFLNRHSWGQMRFSIEWRGRYRFVRAWRWRVADRKLTERRRETARKLRERVKS